MIQSLAMYSLVAVLLFSMVAPIAAAENGGHERRRGWRHHGRCVPSEPCPPQLFGAYCPNRHADYYGARQPLSGEPEAKSRLAKFFDLPETQIYIRRELRMGYIADITGVDGSRLDRVLIDKRNGRIRSIR